MAKVGKYALDEQVGHLLRRVNQRHLSIFAREIPQLTPPQFAVLARLAERGSLSQNELGRAVALDGATVKGVVGRLARQDLVGTAADPGDKRRLIVSLTPAGSALFRQLVPAGFAATRATLDPLTETEQVLLIDLLRRLA